MAKRSLTDIAISRMGWFALIATMGINAVASVDAAAIKLVSLHQLWWLLAPRSLTTAGMALERLAWDPLFLSLLQLPISLILAILMIWLTLRHRRADRAL